MKIVIKNYQRLEKIDLELVNGINLIRGSSNNGKSSVIRAIRDFIFNKISKDKIRHGEDELSIEIDTAKATRNSKGVVYEIDNEKFEKVGRNILPEIKSKFNIDEFQINGVNIKPNFWFQMDKPFLFDKTAGQKNDLLVGTKNDKYLKVLKRIKAEQLELSKVDKKVSEELINNYKKSILELESSIKEKEGIEDLAIKVKEHQKDKNYYNILTDLLNIINSQEDEINILTNKKIEVEEILKEYKLNDIITKRNNLRNKMKVLYNEYSKIKDCNEDIKSLTNRLKDMKSIVLLSDDNINNLYKANEEHKALLIQCEKLLSEYQDNINDNFEDTLLKLKEKLSSKENEFNEYKKEIKICPICGGNL